MTATLGNLIDNNYKLNMQCLNCHKWSTLDVKELAETQGKDTPLEAIGKKARCLDCGALGASIQIDGSGWG